jgi:hypothetical protein
MTDLRQAAQAVLERWDSLSWSWSEKSPTADLMAVLRTALEQTEQEPTPWRDMIVATLVREGINKHKARELADHFAAQPEPPPEWEAINNIIAEYGLQAIDFVADWKAAQRPWVGLEAEEILDLFDRNNVYGSKWIEFARTVEAKLKEKNDH